MPELPEVELVARFLNRLVSGRRITEATLLRDRLAPHTTPKQFAKMLSGAAINFVHRRGKHILFDLDNENSLMTHLRMTGRFMILDKEAAIPKFTHAHFELDGMINSSFRTNAILVSCVSQQRGTFPSFLKYGNLRRSLCLVILQASTFIEPSNDRSGL